MNMDSISKSLNTLFDNKTFSTSMSLLLALYAGAAAPALPNNVIVFFDTVIGKLLITFLIAYLSSKNIQLALMLAVAFVVSLNIINTNKINEGFRIIENYNEDGDGKDGGDVDETIEVGELDEADEAGGLDEVTGALGSGQHEPVEDADEPVEATDEPVETADGTADPTGDGTNDDFTDYEPFVPSTNMFSNTEQYYAPY